MLTALAPAAQAHSVLLSTTPAEAGRVAVSPDTITLTFNEMPRQRYSTVHVFGPDGVRRDSGSVQVVNDTANQSLGGARPAGTYTVDWRVISADGHPVSGQFTYVATSAGAPLAAAVPAATASPDTAAQATDGGLPAVLIALIVLAVAVLLAGCFWVARRRPARAVPAGSSPVGTAPRERDVDED